MVRKVTIAVLLVVMSSFAVAAELTEKEAAGELQKFLNLRTGRWTIHSVSSSSEVPGKLSGADSIEMNASLDLTVHTPPRASDIRRSPWMERINGSAGERKSADVTIVFVSTAKGWRVKSIR